MPSSSPPIAPVDPNPIEIISAEHVDELLATIRESYLTLSQSGLLRPFVRYFLRRTLAISVLSTKPSLYPSDEVITKWINDNKSNHNSLSDRDLRLKLAVQPACSYWARQQWGHLVNSLYLSKKSELDQASCLLLRVKNKDLIKELFYRIKNGESTFRSISFEYGEGPESSKGGLIPLTPLSKLPFGLSPLIPNLNVDVLNGPYRHGSYYSVIQLKEFRPCELDSSVEDYLLSQQLALWIENAVDYLLKCIVDAQPKFETPSPGS